jgi:hypothetical protein
MDEKHFMFADSTYQLPFLSLYQSINYSTYISQLSFDTIYVFIGLPMGLNAAKFPYWYYHIDTITLAVMYSALGFSVGFYGSNSTTLKKKVSVSMGFETNKFI